MDWEKFPDGVDYVIYNFLNNSLFDLVKDVARTTDLSDNDISRKFADLVRELYPYEKVADLMHRWVAENT